MFQRDQYVSYNFMQNYVFLIMSVFLFFRSERECVYLNLKCSVCPGKESLIFTLSDIKMLLYLVCVQYLSSFFIYIYLYILL